jgi:hypothetical protein
VNNPGGFFFSGEKDLEAQERGKLHLGVAQHTGKGVGKRELDTVLRSLLC